MAFYVTAAGKLRPCLMTTDMEFDTGRMGFGGAWRAATEAIAEHVGRGDRCQTCADLPICGYCPALLRLEKGRARRRSEYLCSLGQARRTVLEMRA